MVEGTLIAEKYGIGKYNQNLYILENEGKKIKVWGKTQLDDLMIQVQINDYIRIRYLGVVKTKNQREMKTYSVQKKIGGNGR